MRARITCNPDSDSEFGQLVDEHATHARSAAELERRLRQRYPRARVVEGIANGFGSARWYAYRDGRWVSNATAPSAGHSETHPRSGH